jgi:excisionase family DNA binding protein
VNDEDLITTRQAAEILRVSPSTVLRMVNRDRSLTPTVRAPGLRGALLFRRSDIEALGAGA